MKKSEFQFIVNHNVEDMVGYLMEDYGMSIVDAFDKVYNSQTYQTLQDAHSGIYRNSSAYMYERLRQE